MKKILAIVLMTLLLVTPALASGEAVAQAPVVTPEPACNHYYVVETVEATCTEKGLTTYTCNQCGAGFAMEIPATGHSASAVAATCTEDVICIDCGEVLATAIGHAYTYQMDAVKAEDGSFVSYGTWACDNCGDVIDATEGNAVYYYGETEEAGSSEEASAEASPEAAPAEAAVANPDYDPYAYNWASICLTIAIVIVVVGAVLMLSFGKKKKD